MNKKTLICIGFCICAILLIVASIWDLQISKSLYTEDNFYTIFFNYFGELPLYILITFSFSIFFIYFQKSQKLSHIVISFASIASAYLTICIYLQITFGAFLKSYIIALMSIALIYLIVIPLQKLDSEKKEILYKFAIFTIVFSFAILLINQGVKYIWGRCRFYTMVEQGDYSQFTNWWQINGVNGNKSFYSGHTTSAMSLICLIPLARMFKLDNHKLIVLHVLIYSFVLLVALSRIICGAHFLSDVAFAMIIVGASYLFIYKLASKNNLLT